MALRSLLLQVVMLGCLFRLNAQDLDESNFVRYTRLQGLSNNYVSGIVQDSAGYIWIATHKGMNRFDGKTFQTFFKGTAHSPLPDNLIVSLHHQTCSELVGATRAGAFSFDPITGRYKQFIVPCDSSIYFWTNHVLDIVTDHEGNYVVSTKTGLYIFDRRGKLSRRYDYYTPPDVGRKELIFGGWVNLLKDGSALQQNAMLGSRYDPRYDKIDTNYIGRIAHIKKAIVDTFGEMRPAWLGKNSELFILNTEKNSIEVADLQTPRIVSNILPFKANIDLGWSSTLKYINDSLLIITGKGSGFYVLHYDNHTRILCWDGRKYFTGTACTSFFKDKEGRLWIGTADGLYKQNLHNAFFSVNDVAAQSPALQDHEIKCIYGSDSSLYIGLNREGGVVIVNKYTGALERSLRFLPESKYDNYVAAIYPYSKDTLWLTTNHGIMWLNRDNYHYGIVQFPGALSWLNSEHIGRIWPDSKGNTWFSTGKLNSVIKFDRQTRSFQEINEANNPNMRLTYVFSMAEDLQGNIWLAGDGLCRYNTRTQKVDTLIQYPRVSKLLRNYMYILDRDSDNNLWLSSYDNEIIQFNCTTRTMYLRQQERSQLDGNTITSSPIIDDYIWMGTDNGISAFNIKDYSVKQFTYADGLPSVAITTLRRASFYDKEDNRFYLGARGKLISLVPDVSRSHKVPPALFIEKISVRDSIFRPVPDELSLSYGQNNINIQFNTINFTDPEENRFAWRWIGGGEFDTAWEELNDQTSLTLTNVPGGKHAVQIKLYSVNNRWPQQIKTISFHIWPPFWKSTWFLLLATMLIIGGIIGMYRRRVGLIRKKERDRVRVQQLIAEEYKNRLELEQIINYFSSSLTNKSTVDEVLWDVTENLISRYGYTDCIIYMWNEDHTKMIQRAAFGAKGSPEAIAELAFEAEPGQGLVGWVMETKEAVLVPDTRQDHRYRVDNMSRLSEISVPIIHNNELLGIIDSENEEPDYYKERDLNILTTIATLIGNKIKAIESEETLKVKQDEIVNINGQLAEAQLLALQTQMNPHFIFNSLNSIKGMILENQQQRASRYLSKFAQMIRLTMDQSKEIFASLQENKEYLESYLEMEKLRFDNSFSYEITVDDDVEDDDEEIMIPTLMIQPLAENAIWHGLLHLKGEKNLTIRFSRCADGIICVIEDNGIGINESERLKKLNKSLHKSVGLDNLRNRIKVMNEKYNARCEIRITDLATIDRNRTGTRVVLSFNLITAMSFSSSARSHY